MSTLLPILSLACLAAALRIAYRAKKLATHAYQTLHAANETYARAVKQGEEALRQHEDTKALLGELQ